MPSVESITGYSCPTCGATANELSLVDMSEPEIVSEPDDQEIYKEWIEEHKCTTCLTLYYFVNGV